MPYLIPHFSRSKRFITVFSVVIMTQAVSGCLLSGTSQDSTLFGGDGLVTPSTSTNNSLLQQSNEWATKWQKNPSDPNIAIGYARSLRAAGSNKKAVEVLQQASLKSPNSQAVIAEYGKALSTIGQFQQAMLNLNRAQTLGRPDWRIYSAQGITLDKMAQYSRARKHYKSALNLAPNQPIVLNNIGLSYALDGKLADAETYLRRAISVSEKGSQPKIQRNLALVLGLNGKFNQSAKISNEVLSAEDTTVNIAYLKDLLSRPGTWQKLSKQAKVAPSSPHKSERPAAAKPQKITTLETRKLEPLKKNKVSILKKATKPEKSASNTPATKTRKVEQKTASLDQLSLRTN